MKTIDLDQADLRDINEAIELPEINKRFVRKLLAIKMVASNIDRSGICDTLNISRKTLCNYISEFSNGGISATLEDKSYKPSSSLEPYMDQLIAGLKERPPASSKEAAYRMEQICGIRVSATQARFIMVNKLGMKFRKAGTIPGKCNPQLQMDFLEEELEPRLEEAKAGNRHVYFVDASHFLWGAYASYCWCFERTWIGSASGRKRFNVLGAVNAESKKMVCAYREGTINSETVCSLLIDIYNEHEEGDISIVLDNVPYQHARIVKEMAIVLGIELVYLPPYSPNLNLIERAWKHVKKKALANRHYETYEDFKKSIFDCIEEINTTMKEEMKSLLSLNFQMFPL